MNKIITSIFVLPSILVLPWVIISVSTHGKLYKSVETIPAYEVGVLLGTTPGVNSSNLFFKTRIEATKELYERGKIKHIIVSGDNSNASYNEPEFMKAALVKSGVPAEDITMDFAGFRTLDSIIRAHEIFSLTGGFTIISQPFHVERALFLAQANNIEAIGYGAANVSLEFGLYAYLREIPARWLALYDAWTGTDATVLGKKEIIKDKLY
ncbi:YdcF family protein [Candidatus Gracilibacteria bacterium]|nr:YdcF family protein [Candidatus Gracilibacteria bacterium]